MKFKTKVIDQNKEKQEFEIESDDRNAAISDLRAHGFLILELNEVSKNIQIISIDEDISELVGNIMPDRKASSYYEKSTGFKVYLESSVIILLVLGNFVFGYNYFSLVQK